MLQAFINEGDKLVSNLKYKNEMKVNNNMAIGIFKILLFIFFIEDNIDKGSELMQKMQTAICKFVVPIKNGRKNPRKTNPKK